MAIEQIERLPDVSFIDDDINLDGIQKQMLQDYQDKYMEETGEETVLDRGEPDRPDLIRLQRADLPDVHVRR